MQMSEYGLELLKQWEGFELKVYTDSAGLPSIGVGHLITKVEQESGNIVIAGSPVRYANGLTDQQALDLLSQDVQPAEQAVNDRVKVTLNQNQFDALVAFTFNVGAGAFTGSTLLKVLNDGRYDQVPDQLRRWNKSGGKVLEALVNRRENEIRLWNGPALEDSATPEQAKSTDEGYNEHFEDARARVAQLYEQADSLLTGNKLSDAAILYREIIRILPSEIPAYGMLRDVLERLGRTEEAQQLVAEIEEPFPVRPVKNSSSASPALESPVGPLPVGPATKSSSASPALESSVGPLPVHPATKSSSASPALESPVGPPPTGSARGPESVPAAPASAAGPGTPNRPSEDDSAVLIEAGQIKQDRLKRELITLSELESAAHNQGFASLDEIDRATLGAGGTIAFVGKKPSPEPIPGHRFSPETLRAIAIAEALRRRLEQPVVLRSMLLFGLLESPTGLARLFLTCLGISREALLELLGQRMNRGRRTIGLTELVSTAETILNLGTLDHLSVEKQFSNNLAIVISAAAESIADEQPAQELQPDPIFVALIRSLEQGPGWIGWMLDKNTKWIQQTLADWPKGTFTEESLRDKAIAAGLYSPASASSDAASKDDLLNFKLSASAMVNIVLKHDTVPPLVVGVYGPWGSGKSTYLELVKNGLLDAYDSIRKTSDASKATNLLVVEYDAWAYSDAPKLWAGLITKIAKNLDEDLGWWGRIKYMFDAHRPRLVGGVLLGLIPLVLAVPVVLLGLLKPLSAGLVSATAGPLISIVSAWFAQRQAVFGNVRSLASKFDDAPASGVINSIQDEFRDALESWIKQKTGADAADATIEQRVRDNNLKIVVFIDELDRCPLERIVDILEAIKLFLAKEIFIVFMAVDTRVASEAIRLKYKDVRNPDLPREYLEKIVQLPLRVPTARGQSLNAYLKKFMPNVKDDEPSDAKSNGTSDTASGAQTGAAPAATPGGGATAVAGSALLARPIVGQPGDLKATASPPKILPKVFTDPSPAFLLPQLPDTRTELTVLATISEQFLESNPRKIKRLLNTYRYIKVLAHAHAEPVQSAEWQQTMLGWLAFTMTWPSFMAKAIEKVDGLEPQNEILLSALRNIDGVEARPSETDVSKFLPVSGERLRALWELAGNFLIENADPGSVAHSDAQVKTRSKPPSTPSPSAKARKARRKDA